MLNIKMYKHIDYNYNLTLRYIFCIIKQHCIFFYVTIIFSYLQVLTDSDSNKILLNESRFTHTLI